MDGVVSRAPTLSFAEQILTALKSGFVSRALPKKKSHQVSLNLAQHYSREGQPFIHYEKNNWRTVETGEQVGDLSLCP